MFDPSSSLFSQFFCVECFNSWSYFVVSNKTGQIESLSETIPNLMTYKTGCFLVSIYCLLFWGEQVPVPSGYELSLGDPFPSLLYRADELLCILYDPTWMPCLWEAFLNAPGRISYSLHSSVYALVTALTTVSTCLLTNSMTTSWMNEWRRERRHQALTECLLYDRQAPRHARHTGFVPLALQGPHLTTVTVRNLRFREVKQLVQDSVEPQSKLCPLPTCLSRLVPDIWKRASCWHH